MKAKVFIMVVVIICSIQFIGCNRGMNEEKDNELTKSSVLEAIDYSGFDTPGEGVILEDIPYGMHITEIPQKYSPDVYGNNGVGEWMLRIIFKKPEGLTDENIKYAKEFLSTYRADASELIESPLYEYMNIEEEDIKNINISNQELIIKNYNDFVEINLSWGYME